MAGVGEINVVKVEGDFYPSGSSAHETPTGIYSINQTPSWASGDSFKPYSYIREDTNPTGGVYSSTNWAISLSGDNLFYWSFSGNSANSSEVYLTGENKESRQDIYLPTSWSTTGSPVSVEAFIDDNTYQSGIFQIGESDLSYRITGISIDFEPRNAVFEDAGHPDSRAFSVTVKKNYNSNDFVYYFGNGAPDSYDKPNESLFIYTNKNPFKVSVSDVEAFMQGIYPDFTLNATKKIYITRSNNGNASGSFSDHHHISTSLNSGNLTGSLNPDSLTVQIENYARNPVSGSFGHITGIYDLKEYIGHSVGDGPSKVYENASGSLIQAKRPAPSYDVSKWELSTKYNDDTYVPKYTVVAESDSTSTSLPVSGLWKIKYPSIPSAISLNLGLFHVDGIKFTCSGGIRG
jgi:hypothetical protein